MKTPLYALFLLVSFVMFFSACKKDEQEPPPPPGPIELWDNVHVMDSIYVLNRDSLTGIYEFSSQNLPSDIKPGDIIVGAHGEGYIRKVTNVTYQPGNVVLNTIQGNMEDVFKHGGFDFNMDMSDMGPRSSGFTFNFTNIILLQGGQSSISITEGSVEIDPNWYFDFQFDSTIGISYFEMSAKNAVLNGHFTLKITASQTLQLLERTFNLAQYSKTFIKFAGEVPVVVVMNFDLLAKSSASITGTLNQTGTLETTNSMNLGMKYQNGAWEGIYDLSPNYNLTFSTLSGTANATVNLDLIPTITVKLYGVVGPNLSIALKEQLIGSVASPSLDWDFKADAWLKTDIGADVTILGETLASFNKDWETSKLSYLTPFKLEKTSGDNQIGEAGKQLAEPVKVRVLDYNNQPQSNVPVYFAVTNGGGSVDSLNILSDANGYAQTNWTLGQQITSLHELEVKVKKADGSFINNVPLVFIASSDPCSDFSVTVDTPIILSKWSPNATFEFTADVTGGTPPYTYEWSNGQTNQHISMPISFSGLYSVTVTDSNECTITFYGDQTPINLVEGSISVTSCIRTIDGLDGDSLPFQCVFRHNYAFSIRMCYFGDGLQYPFSFSPSESILSFDVDYFDVLESSFGNVTCPTPYSIQYSRDSIPLGSNNTYNLSFSQLPPHGFPFNFYLNLYAHNCQGNIEFGTGCDNGPLTIPFSLTSIF